MEMKNKKFTYWIQGDIEAQNGKEAYAKVSMYMLSNSDFSYNSITIMPGNGKREH